MFNWVEFTSICKCSLYNINWEIIKGSANSYFGSIVILLEIKMNIQYSIQNIQLSFLHNHLINKSLNLIDAETSSAWQVKSSHHHILTSSHRHIITSSNHHIITSANQIFIHISYSWILNIECWILNIHLRFGSLSLVRFFVDTKKWMLKLILKHFLRFVTIFAPFGQK